MKALAVTGCLLLLVLSAGCSTPGKSSGSRTAPKIESIETGPLRIKLVADTDFNEVTRYVSKTIAKESEMGRKLKKTSEHIEFTVESKIVSVDIEKERMRLAAKTVQKTGSGDLHDFAMPELGEEIVFELDETARVYSAGKYPPASIFFVPPLSLPDFPVRKGDTWTMEAEWINNANSAPFLMQLTSVFKDLIRCGNYRCADIEISGNAKIIGIDETKVRFGSTIRGRYLFVIETGSVLWSVVQADQNFATSKVRADVKNCFFGRLAGPEKMIWDGVQSTTCDPEKVIPADLSKALSM